MIVEGTVKKTVFRFGRNQGVFGLREGVGTFCPGSRVNPANLFFFFLTPLAIEPQILPILGGPSVFVLEFVIFLVKYSFVT